MKFRPILSALFLGLVGAACSGGGLSDNRTPTGSQIMATSSDYSALYVAHTDHGTIGRVPVAPGGAVESFSVGARPTRVARGGNRLFVTLAGERKVAVLEERGEALVEVGRVDVGAEPYGVVASDDGTRVYVTVSLDDRVVELDGGSLEILRTWSVRGQPRWLALHPSGESLYVASAFEGRLTWISLTTNQVGEIAVPATTAFDTLKSEQRSLARRYTGDPAVSADGNYLVQPGLMVNNFQEVPDDEAPGDALPGPVGGGYDAGRFNPVAVVVELEGDGQPAVDTIDLVAVGAFTNVAITGYPSAVAIDPSSEIAVVTIEGASAGIAFNLDQVTDEPGVFDGLGGSRDIAIAPGPGGLGGGGGAQRVNVPFGLPAGPRGIVFADADKPTFYGFIDRSVATLDLEIVRERLEPTEGRDVPAIGFADAAPAFPGEPGRPFVAPPAQFDVVAGDRLEIVEEILSPIEAQGRRLFFATNESKMSASGSGVSCATCHFDGRNDGLTWTFTRGLRQTPSLAGKVSLNAPVRWEGDSPTVAHDAMRTSQGLMGGQGLLDADAQAIEAFIDTTPEVDAPIAAEDAAAARGRAIFERADVGCATCHNGPRFTDKQKYTMKGLAQVQTRSLVGIAASAPYMHDGSAVTLRDVLLQSRDGSMGNTSMLDDGQIDDLVAYLKSL